MTDPDLAKKRFMTLNLIRFAGVAFALLGTAIIAKRWIEPAEIIGGLLIANGAIDLLVIPLILARKWRTPKNL